MKTIEPPIQRDTRDEILAIFNWLNVHKDRVLISSEAGSAEQIESVIYDNGTITLLTKNI